MRHPVLTRLNDILTSILLASHQHEAQPTPLTTTARSPGTGTYSRNRGLSKANTLSVKRPQPSRSPGRFISQERGGLRVDRSLGRVCSARRTPGRPVCEHTPPAPLSEDAGAGRSADAAWSSAALPRDAPPPLGGTGAARLGPAGASTAPTAPGRTHRSCFCADSVPHRRHGTTHGPSKAPSRAPRAAVTLELRGPPLHAQGGQRRGACGSRSPALPGRLLAHPSPGPPEVPPPGRPLQTRPRASPARSR